MPLQCNPKLSLSGADKYFPDKMPSRAWGGVGGCEQTLGGRGHSHEDRWLLILSLVIRQSCLDAACETHPAHALALAALVY